MQERSGAKGVLLLALLSFSVVALSPGAAAHRAGVLPPEFEVDIPDAYFESVAIDAAAASNSIAFHVQSNVTVTTALMSSSQFSSFNNTESGISDSIFIQNGTSTHATERVPEGDYFLVFLAYVGDANVTYSYDLYPNSPYGAGPLLPPEPSGIASFGLYNDSGNVTPYDVKAHEVVGVADISSLLAQNATADLANSTISGATLQLNSVLVVNEKGGSQQVYWVQDTPDFVTSALQVAYVDNVWNYSSSGFLSNSTITSSSGGLAYSFLQSGLTQYYYGLGLSNSSYVFPLDLAVAINASVAPGRGVVVQMGAQVLKNGSEYATPMDWFDNVTIHDPTVSSAYFYVSGNNTTPEGSFYDTEFVFGGEGNGEATSFSQMDASMQLFYDDSSNGTLTYFPSYYSFGQDTAESADNLHASYTGNGEVRLSPGSMNYVYLGRASGTSSLSQLAASSGGASSTTTSAPEFPALSLAVLALALMAVVALATRGPGGGGTKAGPAYLQR
ncbi:MAG TPA: thermopsin [Nitrososphaerales archaeon]|nr:thermopsin [Nitrososphaerales archaeon]